MTIETLLQRVLLSYTFWDRMIFFLLWLCYTCASYTGHPVENKGWVVCMCYATYPVRLVMVPRVMGCLIWARGSTTVRLGSGDSRGFPMLLFVKLLYESWLLSLARNTKKYRITASVLIEQYRMFPGQQGQWNLLFMDLEWNRTDKLEHNGQICQSWALPGNGCRKLRIPLNTGATFYT